MANMLFSGSYLPPLQSEVAVEIAQDQLGALIALAKQHGQFHLTKAQGIYILDIGKYKFNIRYSLEQQIEWCVISLVTQGKINPPAAELCVEVAQNLVINDPAGAHLSASSPEELKLLWWACQKANLRLQSKTPEQEAFFSVWLQEYQQHPEILPNLSTPSHSSFGMSPSQHFTGEASIAFPKDCLGPLLELIDQYGHLNLSLIPEGYILDIGKHKLSLRFTSENHVDLCKISLINLSRLHPGAAEMVAKVLRVLGKNEPSGLRLNALSPEEQKMLWRECRKQEIEVVVQSAEQKTRFALWDQEWLLQRQQSTRLMSLRRRQLDNQLSQELKQQP